MQMKSKSSLLLLIRHFLLTIIGRTLWNHSSTQTQWIRTKFGIQTQKNVLNKVHSKNPESESQKPNSGVPKFVRDFLKNHQPSQMKNPSQQLISSGVKKRESQKPKPSQQPITPTPFYFPLQLQEMIRCFISDTPTPFHKHAHSGLPIKEGTFSHKNHLYHFSENQRARQQTISDDVDLCPQLVMTSTYSILDQV